MKTNIIRWIDALAPILRSTLWRGSVTPTGYDLVVPADERRALAVGWLTLALGSLIGAGVFSVLLVLARTPFLQDLFPTADFFRVALVVHVDLSVLVWFLALGGVLWTINSTARLTALGWAALALGTAGTVLMCTAPFVGKGTPIMSNYVPVLDDPWFLWGLVIFAGGFALLTARSLAAVPAVGIRPDGAAALRFGLNAAAVSAAVALIALAWSYAAMPADIPRKAYFEVLFWGGGHVIQFTFTLFMLVAWLWLASESGARVPLTPRITLLMFSIALAAVFITPVIYLAYSVTSIEHRRVLTWLMEVGGGLAILPVALAVLAGVVRGRAARPAQRPLRAALLASMVLFGVGGGRAARPVRARHCCRGVQPAVVARRDAQCVRRARGARGHAERVSVEVLRRGKGVGGVPDGDFEVTLGNVAAAVVEAVVGENAKQRARFAMQQHHDLPPAREAVQGFHHAHHGLGRFPAARVDAFENFQQFPHVVRGHSSAHLRCPGPCGALRQVALHAGIYDERAPE